MQNLITKIFGVLGLVLLLNLHINVAFAKECVFKRIGKPVCQKAMEALESFGFEETLNKVKATQKGEHNYVPDFVKLISMNDQYKVLEGALAIEATVDQAEEALATIINILEKNDWHATFMLDILITFGPKAYQALPVVEKYLDHENFHLQYWACRVIGAVGPKAQYLVPKLVDKYKNGVLSVRRNAALALGKIGPGVGHKTIELLIGGLDNFFYQIRSTSALALGNLGSFASAALDKLIASFNNPDKAIEFESALAIWQISKDNSYLFKLTEEQYAYQLESNWEDYVVVFRDFNKDEATKAVEIVRNNLLRSQDTFRKMVGLYAIGEMSQFAQAALDDVQDLAQNATDPQLQALAKEIAQEIQNQK